jgi:hypothetical protein
MAAVALPVFLAAQGNGLMPAGKAQNDALKVAQRASQSAAATAINKLAAGLAAGTDRLAGLVRNDQDLAMASSDRGPASIGRRSPALCRRCSTPPMNSRRSPGDLAPPPATSTSAMTLVRQR